MTDFVRPTTADPHPQFYAHCTTCGWTVYARRLRPACDLSEAHVEGCPDARGEIDTVQFIGHTKTPAQRQLDEGHSIHLSAGADENLTTVSGE